MNWKEVESKCPKSFELFKQWYNNKAKNTPFVGNCGRLFTTTDFSINGGKSCPLDISVYTRVLYEFFDDKNMFMFLSLEFNKNKYAWKAFFHTGDSKQISLCFFYDDRVSCEDYAFELLFKHLENDK